MKDDQTWMGRRIDDMSPQELSAALKLAARLVQSTAPGIFTRPDIEVTLSPQRTRVGRAFKWAFIPAGQLWSEEDRAATQARLDGFAAKCGLADAVVHFGTDRIDVEVPRPLQVEQVMALQQWLDSERETLDVSQVP